ncbi:hypothetical protein Droror1_Dr00000121 [Drosera rotundifolia]
MRKQREGERGRRRGSGCGGGEVDSGGEKENGEGGEIWAEQEKGARVVMKNKKDYETASTMGHFEHVYDY